MGKIAGAKMRGSANFLKDTDWILTVNIQTEIKSNELVAVANRIEVTMTTLQETITVILECLQTK